MQKDTEIYNTFPTKINVSTVSSSVFELKRQYEERKQLNLLPSYQRDFVWKLKQKSELIESVLMGIPLPVMYFSQNMQGNIQVVDGKQRLNALFDYIDNKFALTNLNILSSFSKKRFRELDNNIKCLIEDYKITINIIKPPTPERIKLDLFDRVNRGGTRLNNQEMRNAIHQGEATELLEILKDNESFKFATNNAVKSKFMKDRYLILRFIAFYLYKKDKLVDKKGNLIKYRSGIDDFLGATMELLNNMTKEELTDIENIFDKAMKRAYNILGPDGFRASSYSETSVKLKPISMALFDSISYLMTFKEVENNKKLVLHELTELFKNGKFLSAIVTPVNSTVKVNIRFKMIESIIMKCTIA